MPNVLHRPAVQGGFYLRLPDLPAEMRVAPDERVVLSRTDLKRMQAEAMAEGRRRAEESMSALREQVQSEGREAAGTYAALAESLRREQRRVFEEAAQEILTLSYQIAERILRRRVEQDPSAVIPLVRELLQRSASHNSILIRLSPGDYAFLKANLDEVPEAGALEGLRLRPDTSIQPGGCVVETEAGSLNGSLETQLERIAETLFPNGEAGA